MKNNNEKSQKPNILKPWLKYYDQDALDRLTVPECTLTEYLKEMEPDQTVDAIDFYGNMITWQTIYERVEIAARALKAIGCHTGDQVPVFTQSTPEFLVLLLACERIGASLVIRDNELNENAETIKKSKSKILFVNDNLSQKNMKYYMSCSEVEKVIVIPLTQSCDIENIPSYVRKTMEESYSEENAHGDAVIEWDEFLEMGRQYKGEYIAERDIDRPLFRCYTSGSTGPAKQVIHSAHSIVGALTQLNFYGRIPGMRPKWLLVSLPPCLVSVVISFMLLPLASGKLLILAPFCDPKDVDLEFMRCKPNCWPSIPMFCDILRLGGRVPEDYDMSHLLVVGAGCEHLNNTQLFKFQEFITAHGSPARFTPGYGSSEAGSNVGFLISEHPLGNGNVGVPMPLTNVAICTPGTTEELGFNETGEICIQSPNIMLGYDDEAATAKALRVHEDGKTWLHMGDVGYMTEDGVLYTCSRGSSQVYGGGSLDLLPMENAVADANIDGVLDQFFVNIPDTEHEGYYNPYLYVVLADGYTVDDIKDKVKGVLKKHENPMKIEALPKRPYWHFKTHRIGIVRQVLGQTDQTLYPSNMA